MSARASHGQAPKGTSRHCREGDSASERERPSRAPRLGARPAQRKARRTCPADPRAGTPRVVAASGEERVMRAPHHAIGSAQRVSGGSVTIPIPTQVRSPGRQKSPCGECRKRANTDHPHKQYRSSAQENTDLPHKRTCSHRRPRVPGPCQRCIQRTQNVLQTRAFAAGTSGSAHCKESTLANTDHPNKQYRSAAQAITDPPRKFYRSVTQVLPIHHASNTDPWHKPAA